MQRQLLDHSVPGCSGAGYHIFAGKEVSRALAKMSLVGEDCNGNLADLTKHQLDVLQDWETKFQEKYEAVGQVTLSHFSPACEQHMILLHHNCSTSHQATQSEGKHLGFLAIQLTNSTV